MVINHTFKCVFHIHNYRLSVGGGFLLESVGLINFLISVGLILPTGSVTDVPNLGIALSDLSTLLCIATPTIVLIPGTLNPNRMLSLSVKPLTLEAPSEDPVKLRIFTIEAAMLADASRDALADLATDTSPVTEEVAEEVASTMPASA